MLIIFTGNGKGKTTAAIGQALRAVGDGKKVLMVEFIKGPWQSGEDISHKALSPSFSIVKTGKGFVGILGDTMPREVHEQAAHEGLEFARNEIGEKKWDMLILDEIWNALSLGLVSHEDVDSFLEYSKKYVEHVIMTGRDCPAYFIARADIVTEMKEIKHPFEKGVYGTKSIEF